MNPFEVPRCPACGAEVTSTGSGMQTCAACDHRWVLDGAPVERASSPVSGMTWAVLAAVAVGAAAGFANKADTTFHFVSDAPRVDLSAFPVTPGLVPPPAVPPVRAPDRLGSPLVELASAVAEAKFTETNRRPSYLTSFYVVGWVENVSKIEISKPKVLAILRGGDDGEVGQAFGFAERDTLLPGEKSPMLILVKDPPKHHHITFETETRSVIFKFERAEALRVEHDPVKPASFGSGWEVTGKVFNDADHTAKFVQVEVRAFDANGVLLGFDSPYVDGTDVAAHGMSRFRATMMPYGPKPARWEFVPLGRREK